ncbi:MAG: DUF5056 domain-containing protein [Bacteroidales bacterium]|jgi:hypothetical protein|nr:DUF5056 domain-containing protein [Bacteroidales bacterium]MDD3300187.1 DUF5056 domain-containing protein [Bacteroidales bacterium]MDD3843085.1 DUF5056 domain-containing protein [Bacteroidales bacterium]MDD4618354.1 DUF5056 domain-containing protein [Bacteroidales bacterium]
MKDKRIEDFFQDHKQSVPDNGFESRLFATLDCLPHQLPSKKWSFLRERWVITLLFALAGFALFVIFGGYSLLIESLVSAEIDVSNLKSVSPQVIVSFAFMFCVLFGLGKFAFESE